MTVFENKLHKWYSSRIYR